MPDNLTHHRPVTVGLFDGSKAWADQLFHQCDGLLGEHKHILLRPYDHTADHVLIIADMAPKSGAYNGYTKPPFFPRKLAKMRGRIDALHLERICDRIDRPASELSMLVYEPEYAFSDDWFRVANERFGRVFAPDDRGKNPIVLPATWTFEDDLGLLRNQGAGVDRPIDLACITSGKAFWSGHRDRLDFLTKLREQGISMELFGNDLPGHLQSRGSVRSKASVMRAARFSLAIENDATNDRYITEKLWDPLLCWSLPIYYGGGAADTLIDPDAFIRLPNLGQEGIETVLETVSNPGLWHDRLDAIDSARQRVLGDLRLVEWISKVIPDAREPG